MLDLNLSVCDLHYRESVKFTYERDDGLVRSWIDHILCSQAISILVTDICKINDTLASERIIFSIKHDYKSFFCIKTVGTYLHARGGRKLRTDRQTARTTHTHTHTPTGQLQ